MEPERTPIHWRRSSYSNGTGGNNCVEVALTGDTILIRDSKLTGKQDVPKLVIGRPDWAALTRADFVR